MNKRSPTYKESWRKLNNDVRTVYVKKMENCQTGHVKSTSFSRFWQQLAVRKTHYLTYKVLSTIRKHNVSEKCVNVCLDSATMAGIALQTLK